MSQLLELGPVLIANRGEIACRVIASAQAMGYETVAVYSEADAQARHVGLADYAVCIGPAAASDSYLCIESIIGAAKKTGARSIHPGYGFLSENAAFAKACDEAAIVFIGPSIHAIDVMGNKATSKRAMIEAGVPCVPGYQGLDQSDATLIEESGAIGFPLMVKAAAGGGGRGMRLVFEQAELSSAIQSARSEALNSFGSEELIIEKAVIEPRHVEIQVFADSQGNTVHLFERDCSVQRRHQKVLEEAPSSAVTPEIREAMGRAAISAARSVNYVGAGTVEFLLDKNGAFYFLEMNTRLQVEHPVTEMITGLDLVEWQLRVAAGEPLPLSQAELSISGHAIEARLYAEDPTNDFLPAAGTALLWQVPTAPGVRVDHGLLEQQEVSSFYDPMVAKVIAHGKTREEARRKLVRALTNTQILGFPTNREFLCAALNTPSFRSGDFSTAFIAQNFPAEVLKAEKPSGEDYAVLAALLCCLRQERLQGVAALHLRGIERWSNNRELGASLLLKIGDEAERAVKVQMHNSGNRFVVIVNGEEVSVLFHTIERNSARLDINGVSRRVHFASESPDRFSVSVGVRTFSGEDTLLSPERTASAEDDGAVLAPMHGNILALNVSEGQLVEKGDLLLTLEAMKMEHKMTASIAGTVTKLSAKQGQQVALNKLLLEIVPLVGAGND